MSTDIAPRVTDWKALPFAERKREVAERWAAFQRGVLAEGWDIGRGFRATKDQMPHGEWLPWLSEIGISSSSAHRLMALGEGYEISQLGNFGNMEEAVKALPPKRPKEDPPAQPAAPVVNPDAPTDAEGEAAMEEAAREHEEQRDPEAEREEEEERRAMQDEHVDPAERERKAAERHREDVQAVNESRRRENAERRKNIAIRDTWLSVSRDIDGPTLQAMIDDWLAQFFGVARK